MQIFESFFHLLNLACSSFLSCSSLQYVRDSFVIQGKSIAVEVKIIIVSQSLVMLDKYLKACKPYVPRHLRPLSKGTMRNVGKAHTFGSSGTYNRFLS